MFEEKKVSGQWLGRELSISTGKLARQADASVLVQYGETIIMGTVVQSKSEREGIDYFPLMVDLEEKLYAAGIIKGSRWVKREGRPSDQSVLTGRMIDRSVRPLFDESERRDVQLVLTVLSVDRENDHDIVSLIAASAALRVSGVKWDGPLGGIRVGLIDDKLILNPSYEEQEKSSLDLIVAGTQEKVIMIEAGAQEIKEDKMFEAIKLGQENLQEAINIIERFKEEVGVREIPEELKLISEEEEGEKEKKEEILKIGKKWLNENIKEILFDKVHYTKGERKASVTKIKKELDAYLFSLKFDKSERKFVINRLADEMIEAEVSRSIIEDQRRVDGRALDEVRDLSSEVALFPRNHGSGLFTRGETQVLSIATLGGPGLEQTLEDLEGESKKRYMHHYNFPPYSVGEARPLRSAGRREIGHGALAEKAIEPVLPDKESFPYTIRVVSETLGSNGSSSMAATCGSSLALMDAGVPIRKPVAGIAMGLSSNEDMSKWEVLSDIQDLEDGKGGMDFKITGTDEGLTAIQLDTKTNGITNEIIEKTLKQGRGALNKVLESLTSALEGPRENLSPYAPRITSFKIDPEKIGSIIGPGGKIINKIIEETGVTIDIEDDGLVVICSTEEKGAKEAEKRIKDIVRDLEVGDVFNGKVLRIMDFGAFIELTGGKDGMVNVSELAPYRVSKPSDIISIGDFVQVKIKEIDSQGRVNLTMKNLEENEEIWKDRKGEEKSSGNDNKRPAYNNKPYNNKKY